MDRARAQALEELTRLRRRALEADRDLDLQFDRCFKLGCRTTDIAQAAGITEQAASQRRRKWLERSGQALRVVGKRG